jgi:hypothetical protein
MHPTNCTIGSGGMWKRTSDLVNMLIVTTLTDDHASHRVITSSLGCKYLFESYGTHSDHFLLCFHHRVVFIAMFEE